MAILNPTMACADPLHLADNVDALVRGGAEMLHIDIMDGHYVPNLCLSFDQAAAIHRYCPRLPLDLHLMVDDPFAWLEQLEELAPGYTSFHLDSTPFALRLIDRLRNLHIRPGVALNPSQPLASLEEVLARVDFVLVMGVEPGFSGQRFLERTTERIRALAGLRQERGLTFSIMVDGGLDHTSGPACAQAGADILVGGAFVCFGQPDGIEQSCRRFLAAVQPV